MNIEEEKEQLECLKSEGRALFPQEGAELDKPLLNIKVRMNKRIHPCEVLLSTR